MDLAASHIRSVLSKLSEVIRVVEEVYREPAKDLKSMARELRRLSAFLEHVPLVQMDIYERHRLKIIRKLVYDAENLVDYSFLVSAEPASADPDGGGFQRLLRRKTRESSSNPSHEVTGGIQGITKRAAKLFGQLTQTNHVEYRIRDPYIREREYYILANVSVGVLEKRETKKLVGIDGPKDAVLNRLGRSPKVVSVVGAGGSGKTALAHAVYRELKPHFQCAAFVTAPFTLHRRKTAEFLTDMVRQLLAAFNIVDEQQRHPSQIREFLQDKRYLVVIDNLWNEEDWDVISRSLPYHSPESRVITTTRVYDIANLCCSGCEEWIYEIQHLGYRDSKELFLKQLSVYSFNWDLARTDLFIEILKMCGGTPSAIITMASLLGSKVTVTNPWHKVESSVYTFWKQTTSSLHSGFENISGFEDFRHILSLTYLHLPSTLKACLLYMATYAKDRMIPRTTMVGKWIAEGFISEYRRCSREEVASRYFDELINRNFIKLVEYGNYLGEELYEFNNVVLYILRLISQETSFATVLSDAGIPSEHADAVRCLSIIQCSGSNQLSVHTENMDLSGIRSITIVGPAKFSLNNSMVYLRVLDIDGCKDLDNSIMDHICRMFLLEYLGIKQTQVTEIPPEIGKLQFLATLDIRQNEISNLPPEIGKLQALKTLDARRTRISCLPPEIRLLQNLETLDVRQTQVIELPKEVAQLPKLAHLYFGQSSSLPVVRLPAGIDQLESVEVLGTVDSREWSASAMEEISWLIGVRGLEVVFHDRPADKNQNVNLLSAIGYCKNLEYLIIYGDYNPSNGLPAASPYFPRLQRMKVAGRFVRVPRWIAKLSTLKKLDIRVCKVDQDDLKILGSLTGLSTLALALICIPRKKEVTFTSRLHSSTCTCKTKLRKSGGLITLAESNGIHDFGQTLVDDTNLPPSHPSSSQPAVTPSRPPSVTGDMEDACPTGFTSLEVFNFDCHVPWITFEQGAMRRLKHIHMKLYAGPADKLPSGIINLPSLHKIVLRYSSHYASSGGVTKAVAAIRKEAASHYNVIELSVNDNLEVFKSRHTL